MHNNRTDKCRWGLHQAARFAGRVHADERGAISLLTVFAMLMMTMLLVMITNVARHVDDKIKMQNAADAAAYSGGVVLARGMNAVAFSNHLLADVFGLTAFLREGRDRNAEQLTPEILDAWEEIAPKFGNTNFQKIRDLAFAVQDKVPKERALVSSFGDMTQAASMFALPVFEHILREELIPEFQRTVIHSAPPLAQQVSREIAWRHGLTQHQLEQLGNGGNSVGNESPREPQVGVLWRGIVSPVGDPDESDPLTRTLPVIDPDPRQPDYWTIPNPADYNSRAIQQRRSWAKHYLALWTSDKLRVFDREAKMSQFANLWRIATCAQLEGLLTEDYPTTNLPMMMRQLESGEDLKVLRKNGRQTDVNQHLEDNFSFVAVIYRKHLFENGPGLFKNPLQPHSDGIAFAQVALFPPAPRYRDWVPGGPDNSLGGTFGYDGIQPPNQDPPDPTEPRETLWVLETRFGWPLSWDLWNQNWTIQLVPATLPTIPAILQTPANGEAARFRLPNLGGATSGDLQKINTH